MEFERYLELQTVLQQWKTRLAESIRRRIELDSCLLDRLQELYEADGASEEFTLWLDRWCRQAAIQFILRILFLRVLEDRGLLGATRIRSTDGQKMWGQLTRNLGAAAYMQWCCWDAAHLLPDLFGPSDYDLVLPDDELAQRFLDEVWRRPDPNRPGWLRFDFRQDPERDDKGFQTRFIGDLYQDMDAEIRERYALLQTPHFISQFILEHTLLKRFEEKDFREVTLIDPTCGSGHFLVDAFWHFVRKYESLALKTLKRKELTPTERIKIARRVIEEHIFGCDINAYATALTRFRLALAICDYAHPTSLNDLRDLRFNIVTIDSLIPYEKMIGIGEWTGEKTAQILGNPEDIRRALPVLKRRFDVVVGNPPYIFPKDAAKRKLYKKYYPLSTKGKYGLSAPFVERFLQFSTNIGRVGFINSNAFSLRGFGRDLIEKVLPNFEIEMLVDTSGAYIPGHTTPTLILFITNKSPELPFIFAIANLVGEPEIPRNPSKGLVWLSIIKAVTKGLGYSDEYVETLKLPRSIFFSHPWNFGGPHNRLFEKLRKSHPSPLVDFTNYLGPGTATNLDEVFSTSLDYARRLGVSQKYVKPFIHGEHIRDWMVHVKDYTFFPYRILEDGSLESSDLTDDTNLFNYFSSLKPRLENRPALPASYKWYEYTRKKGASFLSKVGISYAEITTHNHAFVINDPFVIQRSAAIIELKTDKDEDYKVLCGLLNSSVSCFLWKRRGLNKKPGEDPIRDNFAFSPNLIFDIPIPSNISFSNKYTKRLTEIVDEQINLRRLFSSTMITKTFEKKGESYFDWYRLISGIFLTNNRMQFPFANSAALRNALNDVKLSQEKYRRRMIFLQEELDWLCYEMYGLISKAPLAEDYLTSSEYKSASLDLGQRAYEIAGEGYEGDWPIGYKPAPLPDYLKPLSEARIAVIERNPDIALLEDPLYKRRWIPRDYEKEFQEAAEWWLAEKLEYASESHGKPISLRQWVRLLRNDERVNAVLEVLTGTQAYDLEGELLKVIQANMVPNLPEHYLKPSGLRKYKLWQHQNESSVPPEFKSSDFSDSTAWKIRGKLNIPRERFIAYTEFDHTSKGCDAPKSGGPWFGWAGWDAAKRADALAFLLEQANRAGWELHFRQCGLRAALRELLPQLEGLPEADQLEFKGLATMCGISLETECYCRSYREGMVNGEPTVPGVSEDVLGVKVLESKVNRPKRKSKKGDAEQLHMDL